MTSIYLGTVIFYSEIYSGLCTLYSGAACNNFYQYFFACTHYGDGGVFTVGQKKGNAEEMR